MTVLESAAKHFHPRRKSASRFTLRRMACPSRRFGTQRAFTPTVFAAKRAAA
jgi:hypothetical protein